MVRSEKVWGKEMNKVEKQRYNFLSKQLMVATQDSLLVALRRCHRQAKKHEWTWYQILY